MFNNANVIFRTKFVDGVSTVTRTIGIGRSAKSRALRESGDNRQEEQPHVKKHQTNRRNQSKLGKENTVF